MPFAGFPLTAGQTGVRHEAGESGMTVTMGLTGSGWATAEPVAGAQAEPVVRAADESGEARP